MASRVGIAIRNERANERIDAVIEDLSATLGIEGLIPEQPTRPGGQMLELDAMLCQEWLAEAFETIAAAMPEPVPAG